MVGHETLLHNLEHYGKEVTRIISLDHILLTDFSTQL